MFQFPSLASVNYEFINRYSIKSQLSDSEISGSKRMCRSPKLIAAYHVLHRLSVPRHSPWALSSFIKMELIPAKNQFKQTIQFSKSVTLFLFKIRFQIKMYKTFRVLALVGLGWLEHPTPRLSSVCSNQLSYRPIAYYSLKTKQLDKFFGLRLELNQSALTKRYMSVRRLKNP